MSVFCFFHELEPEEDFSEEYLLADSAALSHISCVSFPRLTSLLPFDDEVLSFPGEEDPLVGDPCFLNMDDEELEKDEDENLDFQEPVQSIFVREAGSL